ncbi:MAG TPA: DUF4231 domain-containing protein [Pseudonocardiaceae bacterium]|jgi:hypothetical protein|nr:DUF4231 domain-containing protein [Pseudonocardiaceae bacterium]
MHLRTTGQEPDPWESADPALTTALRELHWYQHSAARARIANQASEVLLLALSAATTVAAAISAPAWLTATLAAAALVTTGMRKSFDWHESWISWRATWGELRSMINQYRLLPEVQRDEQARRTLMAQVDEIVNAETGRWAARRRKLGTPSQTEA